jgi:hypothetical protein
MSESLKKRLPGIGVAGVVEADRFGEATEAGERVVAAVDPDLLAVSAAGLDKATLLGNEEEEESVNEAEEGLIEGADWCQTPWRETFPRV